MSARLYLTALFSRGRALVELTRERDELLVAHDAARRELDFLRDENRVQAVRIERQSRTLDAILANAEEDEQQAQDQVRVVAAAIERGDIVRLVRRPALSLVGGAA